MTKSAFSKENALFIRGKKVFRKRYLELKIIEKNQKSDILLVVKEILFHD